LRSGGIPVVRALVLNLKDQSGFSEPLELTEWWRRAGTPIFDSLVKELNHG
jgi:hypothetical protein